MRQRTIAGVLSTLCLVPMAVAAVGLSLAGRSDVAGLVDDAATCVAAGAMYVAERDECAFTTDVAVPAGDVLILGDGISAYSFHRDLDVRGTLVARSDVRTAGDTAAVLAGHLELRDAATLRPLDDDERTTATR